MECPNCGSTDRTDLGYIGSSRFPGRPEGDVLHVYRCKNPQCRRFLAEERHLVVLSDPVAASLEPMP